MVNMQKSFLLKHGYKDAPPSRPQLLRLLENCQENYCQRIPSRIRHSGYKNFRVERDVDGYYALKIMQHNEFLPIVFIDIAFLCYVYREFFGRQLIGSSIFFVYESLRVDESMLFKIDDQGNVWIKTYEGVLNLTKFVDKLPSEINASTPEGTESHV